MSWDIVLICSTQRINDLEELDETKLVPTDFCTVLEHHFEQIIQDGNHREIRGKNFTIGYFLDEEKVSIKILNLHVENGLYELVVLAREYQWQLFDTGLGQMIDLDNPSKNGYANFKNYLKQI
ncbi:MAG: hypothetical protein L6Q78_07455 [Bacteroidia bacterium]|nr:hypothetical protein [Bacteroidia bacterium]